MKSVLKYFPEKIEYKIAEEVLDKFDNLEEIRIRALRPIILKLSDGEKVIKYSVSTDEILSCLQLLCENSIYSYLLDKYKIYKKYLLGIVFWIPSSKLPIYATAFYSSYNLQNLRMKGFYILRPSKNGVYPYLEL